MYKRVRQVVLYVIFTYAGVKALQSLKNDFKGDK